ncbi:hypothetical protein ABZZ04_17750 [Streptomyces sp. NPDC006435]|uniref:hypothetical protein n=1 Tax=Streptomyces sp. NPDC006435 TaxID=3154300 RepID=UPI0033A19C8C
MLRITDTRTGHLVDVPAAPRRLLRSSVHLPPLDTGTGTGTTEDTGTGTGTGTTEDTGSGTGIGPWHLRVLLVGDVLARTAELNGLQVVTVLTTGELTPDRTGALDRIMAVLGIHPPTAVAPHRPDAALGGPADVCVLPPDDDGDDGGLATGVRIEVGRVGTAPPEQGASTRELLGAPDPSDTADPLAVRLLLLGHPHTEPLTITGPALAEARRTLRGWRGQVADWARHPSKPIPADLLRQSYAALTENLDTAAVLDLLTSLVDRPDIPPGARFETFAHLDRVLGLDLARDIGH